MKPISELMIYIKTLVSMKGSILSMLITQKLK